MGQTSTINLNDYAPDNPQAIQAASAQPKQPAQNPAQNPSGINLNNYVDDSSSVKPDGGMLGRAAIGALDSATKAHNEPLNPPSFASTLPRNMSVSAAPKSTGVMNSMENWFRDAADDMKYGTGKTEFGRILQKVGAQPLANEATQGEQAMMPTSIVTGALHTGEGLSQLAQHEKRIKGLENTVKGLLEASTVPAQVAGVPESGLDEGAELAAKTAGKVADTASNAASKVGQTAQAIVKGGKVAQKPAQEALRTAAGATDTQSSLRGVLEQPIADTMKQAKSLYKKFDDAAGVDYRDLQSKLSDVEWKIKQALDPETEARLTDARNQIADKIETAKQTAQAQGVDPSVLDQADSHFKQASALQDLQKKLFKNPSVVAGDTTKGAAETVDVDTAIKTLQRLDQPTKYGNSRLVQALGSRKAADQLLSDLYSAQKAGQSAINARKLAKTISKYVAYISGAVYGVHAVLRGLGE